MGSASATHETVRMRIPTSCRKPAELAVAGAGAERWVWKPLLLALFPALAACRPSPTPSSVPPHPTVQPPPISSSWAPPPGPPVLERQVGEASYYSDALAGRSTASGEPYDPRAFTAAHRTLPFGTVLRVVRQDGGQTTYVRVNDRGPFGSRRRIVDLSRAAAEQLDLIEAGVCPVVLEVLARPGR